MNSIRYIRYLSREERPQWGVEVRPGVVARMPGPPWSKGSFPGAEESFEEWRRLAPVEPTKIICVGRNYLAHARELGNVAPEQPVIFMKPPSAIQHPRKPIILPRQSAEVHYEGEIAVVVGARLKRATLDQAREGVLGVTAMVDVTARDLQREDKRFTRAKGFDTFAPLGPALVTELDLTQIAITVKLDGQVVQQGNSSDMTWSIPELLVYISSIMTLEPGDVVSTGTPAGVGPMKAGQKLEVNVEGVGVLSNPIEAEAA
ncbi:MAG: putative protein YisK [Myxococcota bacterium]|nr:putative protein YisK [Myxococcota bacterium]